MAKNCDKKKLVNACLLRMPRCAFVYKGMEIYIIIHRLNFRLAQNYVKIDLLLDAYYFTYMIKVMHHENAFVMYNITTDDCKM